MIDGPVERDRIRSVAIRQMKADERRRRKKQRRSAASRAGVTNFGRRAQ